MDGQYFDAFARRMAGATSRRTLIAGFAAAVLGARLGRANVAAQGECASDDDCPDENYCDGAGQCSCLGPLSTCTVDSACCGGGDCVGGQCRIRQGSGCLESSWCTTGFCVNQVCCSSACEGECNDCGVIGGSGVCTDINANCSDGNNCTVDICMAGICSSSAMDCSELDDVCRTGICDTSTGTCVAVNHEDGTACGANATCNGGACQCNSGYILCDSVCVAGDCCSAIDCDLDSSPENDSGCATMICNNHTCQLATGDGACGPCQECDLALLICIDTCSEGACCCDDGESCSEDCCPAQCNDDSDCPAALCCCSDGESCSEDCCPEQCNDDSDCPAGMCCCSDGGSCSEDCCPDSCTRHKGCPKGLCCCKDGSCRATCCDASDETPLSPDARTPDSTVSTLPGTGSGSTADSRDSIAGLAITAGFLAWAASKVRSVQHHDSGDWRGP